MTSNVHLTDYVVTRWYRAPEITMSQQKYSGASDMWSVGCILAQMITGKPLLPGSDTNDQLKKMYNVLGAPDAQFLNLFDNNE